MRIVVLTLAVLASLTACGGGEEDGSQVFKSMGSRQCSGGGVSLATLQAQLATANVQVHSAACGTDGMATSAVCGASDGKIGIFEISPAQAGAAAAAGFAPLSTLPAAKTISCG
jgi:DnaJ-class molecular chaperone